MNNELIGFWSSYEKLWEEGNVPDLRYGRCPLDRLYVAAVAERRAERAG